MYPFETSFSMLSYISEILSEMLNSDDIHLLTQCRVIYTQFLLLQIRNMYSTKFRRVWITATLLLDDLLLNSCTTLIPAYYITNILPLIFIDLHIFFELSRINIENSKPLREKLQLSFPQLIPVSNISF